MEGYGVGSAECVVYVDVHGEVSYVVGGYNVISLLSMVDMVCLVCRSGGVQEQCWFCMACL